MPIPGAVPEQTPHFGVARKWLEGYWLRINCLALFVSNEAPAIEVTGFCRVGDLK